MGRTFVEEIASVQDQAAATNGATFLLGRDPILDGLERGPPPEMAPPSDASVPVRTVRLRRSAARRASGIPIQHGSMNMVVLGTSMREMRSG